MTSSILSAPDISVVRELVGAEILVIDRDPIVQAGMAKLCAAADLNVTCVEDPSHAWELLDKSFFSVVVVDLDTPHPNAGLETVTTLRIASPTSMIIMLTPRKSFADAVASLRVGAVDVIYKAPESVEHLRLRIRDAVSRSAAKRESESVMMEIRQSHEDFLRRLMGAERRALDFEDRLVGRDPAENNAVSIRVLVVSPDPELAKQLARAVPPGFEFESATSGGQALDRASSSRFDLALMADGLEDLPTSMVATSLTAQNAEIILVTFSGPGPSGRLTTQSDPLAGRDSEVVGEFREWSDLIPRLNELAEGFRVRERERRYLNEFRQRHYDFLRKFVKLKARIEHALARASADSQSGT